MEREGVKEEGGVREGERERVGRGRGREGIGKDRERRGEGMGERRDGGVVRVDRGREKVHNGH